MSYSATATNVDYDEEEARARYQSVPLPKDDDMYGEALDNAEAMIRVGFVRKVFGILAAQLAATLLVMTVFATVRPVRAYVDFVEHPDTAQSWPFGLAMVGSFMFLIGLTCFPSIARRHPQNLGFLVGFTLCEAVLLGTATVAYDAESILTAVALTAGITCGLVMYATTTKSDFTGAGPYLFMMLWSLILFGILMSFFPGARAADNLMQTVYGGLGALLFSFYIVYDVQLVVGGKHNRFKFGVDDYVFAALNIYLDIINLFIRILQLFGNRRD